MTEKETIDIEALVQNNPLTRLTSDHGSKIIQKIRERFSPEEQQFYVANLYCYLNYNSKTDFVIILDRIWKWLGYNRINDCYRVLLKNFKENVDYKIENFALQDGKANPKPLEEPEKETRGGHNREYITLTVNCFKKLCLKSRTEKADQIHDYYIGLEELINELVTEQTEELQIKLQNKDKQLQLKDSEICENLISNFKNKQVVYLIIVEIVTIDDITYTIIKFGYTKDIEQRFKDHKSEFGKSIVLKCIFETIYNREFEEMIKIDSVIKPFIIEKKYKSNQTELIQLDKKFTYTHLINRIDYVKSIVNESLISNLINEISLLKLENAELRIKESDSQKTSKLTNRAAFYKNKSDKLLESQRINKMQEDLKKNPNVKIPDKLIYNSIQENIYQSYIHKSLDIGEGNRCSLIELYENFYKWYKNDNILMYNTGDKNEFKSIFKEEFIKCICKLTGLDVTRRMNFVNKAKGINLAGYAGFIGIGIKQNEQEDKLIFYKNEVYTEFLSKQIVVTNVIKDKMCIREILDIFVNWLENNQYQINEQSQGKSRYSYIFIEEFVKIAKNKLNIAYNPTGRKIYNGIRCAGYFIGIKISQ